MTAPKAERRLQHALRNRWRNYTEELDRCRANLSEKTVHDFRVAIRRFASLLRLVEDITGAREPERLRKKLKAQLDDLDELRDIHVMLAELTKVDSNIDTVIESLEADSRRAATRLKRKLAGIDTQKLVDLAAKVHKAVDAHPAGNVQTSILESIDRAWRTVSKRIARVDKAKPVSFHRLRVAFKRFRYSVEDMRQIVGRLPDDLPARMDAFQTRLGEIQDADVIVKLLTSATRRNPQLASTRDAYRTRRDEKIAQFTTELAEGQTVSGFWRPDPQSTFPWET
ncbi:MAG: CHAD domain-containing protein [Pseudomonadales bacterium]|nr:CHAD domain-containing protein [Pseudomonadales bacterium]